MDGDVQNSDGIDIGAPKTDIGFSKKLIDHDGNIGLVFAPLGKRQGNVLELDLGGFFEPFFGAWLCKDVSAVSFVVVFFDGNGIGNVAQSWVELKLFPSQAFGCKTLWGSTLEGRIRLDDGVVGKSASYQNRGQGVYAGKLHAYSLHGCCSYPLDCSVNEAYAKRRKRSPGDRLLACLLLPLQIKALLQVLHLRGKMMKAYTLNQVGDVDNLALCEVDRPTPKSGEVLIEVKAIGINPIDMKTRASDAVLNMVVGEERPAILGWDIAGTVVATGDDATRFACGDRVFGMVNFPGHGKGYAEYVAASESHLAAIPAETSFADAAATTLAALTALQVLRAHIQKDDRVLIHAGAGGVGHFAIQMAKNMGAYVVATSSAKNRDFIVSLGADMHIDYRTQKFEEMAHDIDFVLDGMGDDVLAKSLNVVKQGGAVVSLPSPAFSDAIKAQAKARNIGLKFIMVQSSGEDMGVLKEMLQRKTLKPYVSKTFSWDRLVDAHKHIELGRTVGKVVVDLD